MEKFLVQQGSGSAGGARTRFEPTAEGAPERERFTPTVIRPDMQGQVSQLVKHWSFVRKGCLSISEQIHHYGHSGWTPEHIRASVLAGNAEFFGGYRREILGYTIMDGMQIGDGKGGFASSREARLGEEQLVGFFITSIITDPFLHIPVGMFVWIAYSEGHGTREGLELCKKLGKERGLLYLECMSSVPDFEIRMSKIGWKEVFKVLRIDLVER